MNFKTICCLLVTFVVTCLSSCSSFETRPVNNNDYVTVSMPRGEHYEVLDGYIKTIKRGDNVSFSINIDNGFVFDEVNSEGEFNNNVYTIYNIQYSKTAKFKVDVLGNILIEINNDSNLGTITITPNKSGFAKGDLVTIECVPKSGNRFISYSYNAFSHDYTRNGWIKVGTPFTFSNKYSFVAEKSLSIYVNYYNTNNFLTTYDGNGGLTKDNKTTIDADFYPSRDEYSPNSLQGSRYFVRNGFILESWNTNKDGSGQRIGLGSIIPKEYYNEQKQATLYAHWIKETNYNCFKYSIDDDGCHITEYNENGNDADYLAIPAYFDNRPIVSIESNSIITKKQKLFFSNSIQIVESEGIVGENVEQFLFFSSLKTFKEHSIFIPNCETCFINSETFTTNHEECMRDLTRRYEDIKLLNHQKKLVLMIGHSTLYQNHDLTLLQDTYGDKYDFQLFGATWGTNTKLMIEMCNFLTRPDDIVLLQMHESAVAADGKGYDTIARVDLNFDIFSQLNFREYLDCFYQSFNECSAFYTTSFEEPSFGFETKMSFSLHGETVSMNQDDYNVSANNVGPSTLSIAQRFCTEGFYSSIKKELDKNVANKKIITWTTYNRNAVESTDSFSAFENAIKNDFYNYYFIDSIFDNFYDGQYFRKNDNSHLNVGGGNLRIERWSEALSSILL